MTPKTNFVTDKDFEKFFKYTSGSLPPFIKEEINKTDTSYRMALKHELMEYVLMYIQTIDKFSKPRTKEQNLNAFENGWLENFINISTCGISLKNLKPGYFRDSKFLRYNNDIVISENLQLDFDLFKIARMCIFNKYFGDPTTICELGCGSCQNALIFSQMYPFSKIICSDWTKSTLKIVDYLNQNYNNNISGYLYDLTTNEPLSFIPINATIVSIHSFEQLGTNFKNIVHNIIDRHPKIVLQYEPIMEFYNSESLLDYLALSYCNKRGYLNGYFTYLRNLEKKGEIEIIEAYRPFLGDILHESSIIVWRPK